MDLQQSLLELDGRAPSSAELAVLKGYPSLGVKIQDHLLHVGREALAARVAEFGTPASAFKESPDGPPQSGVALRECLGAHSSYDGEASTVVPMNLSALAVPSAAGTCQPALGEAIGPYSVQGFCAQHILPSADAEAARASRDLSKAYLDPCLRSQKRYSALLLRLHEAGMIRLSRVPGIAQVGLFTVRKKDGRQRLVVDARPADLYFGPPPATSLPSGSSFSRIAATEKGMFFSGLDLRDFFYHLSLPDELCPYFQLPPIRAYFLHQQGVCFDVPASAMVYPLSPGRSHGMDACA